MNTFPKTKENSLSLNLFVKLILSISCCFVYTENTQAQKRDVLVKEYLNESNRCAFENKKDSAIFYLHKAEQQALGNPEELYRVYSRCGTYFFKEEITLDSARVYLKKMQELLPDTQDPVQKAKIYNKTGYFSQLDGETGKAFSSYKAALEINSAQGELVNTDVLAKSYARMARLYAKLEMFDKAIDCAKKAMRLVDNGDIANEVFVYRHAGCVYKKMDKYDDALKHFQKAAHLNKNNEKKKRRANYDILIKKNLAEIYHKKGDNTRALSLALESMEDSEKAKQKNLEENLYLLLSLIYSEQGDMDLALKNGLKSYEIAELKDIPGKLLTSSRQLKELYKKRGDTARALHFSEIYNRAKGRFNREEGKLAIAREDYLKAEEESKEKLQVVHANSEKLRLSALLITGALLMSIGFGFIFYKRKKERFLQLIERKEKAKFRMQQKLIEEKEKAIEKEEELKVYTQLLSKDASTTTKDLKGIKEIVNELHDFKILTENDWTGFKSIFQNVYPEFFRNFKVKSKNYSQGDLKLAALIRLNLNTKEIAEILAISPDSVRKSKYRLRKKMSLASEKELQKFIYDL
ncbi:tetratricopeptide repeat protein [Kordia sp.]|uniref:tetratricopeptide repeat protein n=1 Tax=Kordia sp. TaxID=1965332 RepID=UPI003D6B9F52